MNNLNSCAVPLLLVLVILTVMLLMNNNNGVTESFGGGGLMQIESTEPPGDYKDRLLKKKEKEIKDEIKDDISELKEIKEMRDNKKLTPKELIEYVEKDKGAWAKARHEPIVQSESKFPGRLGDIRDDLFNPVLLEKGRLGKEHSFYRAPKNYKRHHYKQ